MCGGGCPGGQGVGEQALLQGNWHPTPKGQVQTPRQHSHFQRVPSQHADVTLEWPEGGSHQHEVLNLCPPAFSFNLRNTTSSYSLYSPGSGGSERESHLPKHTQLIRGRGRGRHAAGQQESRAELWAFPCCQTQVACVQTLCR